MKILLASNNDHKLREFRRILNEHTVDVPRTLGFEWSHDETGTSFVENALGKAESLYGELRSRGIHDYAVIADDSGLCVKALGGAPGLYSARYGKELGASDDAARTLLLLKNMNTSSDRTAWYICAIALYAGPDRFLVSQDRWNGTIAREVSKGQHGFGYDPVFIPDGKTSTIADLDDAWKDVHSHRGKALAQLMPSLTAIRVPGAPA